MSCVGIPVDISANSNANVKLPRDIICIFSSEDQLQSLSKQNMEQIRNTMMQHEQLFKEQLESLHKLYNVQISAMQDIGKLIYCPAKLLASNSDTIEVDDHQCHSSVVDEKSLKPVCVAAKAYYDQSSVLAVHPLLAVKEFTGCSPEQPFWLDNQEVKPTSTRKDQRREIDLERPPEEYIDETDYSVEANNYGVPDSDNMLKEASDRNCYFYKESKLSLNQHADQPLWLLQASQPFTVQMLNCNDSADFLKSETPQLERKEPEEAKESTLSLSNTYLLSSTQPTSEQFQQYQALEGTDKIRISQMKLNQQSQDDLGKSVPSHEDLVQLDTKNIDDISTRGFSLSEMDSPSQKHNNCNWVLRCQTDEDDRNENPNLSGHGSNSPVSQGGKVCRDGDISTMAIKNRTDGIDCEQPMGHLEVLSEHEETPQLIKDEDIKPLASSISHSEIDQREQENCVNSWQHQNAASKTISNSHGTVKYDKVVTDKKGNQEDFNSESKLEEACESIAAKILLSFAPCSSRTDAKWQSSRTWIDAESSQSGRDSTSHGKKQNKHVRRSMSYSNGGGIKEAVKWTKSVRGRRRRTSRRQR